MTAPDIYPVPVKPASSIGRWGQWPPDVEPLLLEWNRERLSFMRGRVFKCIDCDTFCERHALGAAQLDGDLLCDDCLIARARRAL